MREFIIKTLSVIFFIAAISLLGIYVVAPFFEEKQDLYPRVADDQSIEEITEQENDTI